MRVWIFLSANSIRAIKNFGKTYLFNAILMVLATTQEQPLMVRIPMLYIKNAGAAEHILRYSGQDKFCLKNGQDNNQKIRFFKALS